MNQGIDRFCPNMNKPSQDAVKHLICLQRWRPVIADKDLRAVLIPDKSLSINQHKNLLLRRPVEHRQQHHSILPLQFNMGVIFLQLLFYIYTFVLFYSIFCKESVQIRKHLLLGLKSSPIETVVFQNRLLTFLLHSFEIIVQLRERYWPGRNSTVRTGRPYRVRYF